MTQSRSRRRTQAFNRGGLFIVGAGETLDEFTAEGEWVAASEADAVEVRR